MLIKSALRDFLSFYLSHSRHSDELATSGGFFPPFGTSFSSPAERLYGFPSHSITGRFLHSRFAPVEMTMCRGPRSSILDPSRSAAAHPPQPSAAKPLSNFSPLRTFGPGAINPHAQKRVPIMFFQDKYSCCHWDRPLYGRLYRDKTLKFHSDSNTLH